MFKHLTRHHHLESPTAGYNFTAQIQGQHTFIDVNSTLTGIGCGIGIGLHSGYISHARLGQGAEEHAVVAARLQQGAAVQDRADNLDFVGHMGLWLPVTETIVVIAVKNLRIDGVGNLGKAAAGTERHAERI